MAFFGLKKKNEVIDLSERYRKQQEKIEEMKQEKEQEKKKPLTFFESLALSAKKKYEEESASKPESPNFNRDNEEVNFDSDTDSLTYAEEKKKRLAKRIADMTTKLEELSNQIYHLQQRVELLERKSGLNLNKDMNSTN